MVHSNGQEMAIKLDFKSIMVSGVTFGLNTGQFLTTQQFLPVETLIHQVLRLSVSQWVA
jgi:hypothetical protein